MKLLNTRFIAWMLTLALVATLLPLTPAAPANAASAYFQFDDYSTSDQAPSEVNSNVIDIAGTFSGVSSTTINYKIEKLIINGSTTKVAESSVGSTKPIITGSNSFRFTGITIYDGLNRITVTGTNTAGNIVDGTAYVKLYERAGHLGHQADRRHRTTRGQLASRDQPDCHHFLEGP